MDNDYDTAFYALRFETQDQIEKRSEWDEDRRIIELSNLIENLLKT